MQKGITIIKMQKKGNNYLKPRRREREIVLNLNLSKIMNKNQIKHLKNR